jgi:putative hemolysin
VRQPDGSWLVDGGMALEDLEAALDLDPMPEEERRGVRTVAGLVLARIGHLPRTGESVTVGATTFRVEALDGRRVARLRVETRAS